MFTESPFAILLGFLCATPISFLILFALGKFIHKQPARESDFVYSPQSATFLFQDDLLINHDACADCLFGKHVPNLADWPTLREWLGTRFGSLPEHLEHVPNNTNLDLVATDPTDKASLVFKRNANITHMILTDPILHGPADRHEAISNSTALKEHITALRHAPCAICISSADGQTVWQNTVFQGLSSELKKQILSITPTTTSNRIMAQQDGEEYWYEIQIAERADRQLRFASDITRIVAAERSQQQFVQTLTKTFATLTTGLALFDRNRQLVLFNPALTDLTGLSVKFLTARPNLISFFDNLRDRQVMPEPKNYNSWRAQITKITESASDGFYQEVWAPPSGLTYRVTGRPHPDGAVAFLFEDISDEVSLTRRFRAQLELRQSVMDSLPEAMAVIAPNNILLVCNSACSKLLKIDPDSSIVEMTMRDMLSIYQKEIPGDAYWSKVATQIASHQLQNPITKTLKTRNGITVSCTVTQVSGGSIVFRLLPLPQITVPRISDALSA